VVALIGLYFVGDVVLLRYIESRGATQVAQALDAESATTHLGSIPFIPSFLGGHLHQVSGRVDGASAPGGLRVDRVEVQLTDVKFSPGHVFSLVRSRFAARTDVRATQALVTLQLSERDIKEYLTSKIGAVSDVRVSSVGVAITFASANPVSPVPTPTPAIEPSSPAPSSPPPSMARFLPHVTGGVLQLELVGSVDLASEFRNDAEQVAELVRLPRLPKGLQADVRLGDGVIVVEAQGSNIDVRIGEATR
jgi:hypothetical protein